MKAILRAHVERVEPGKIYSMAAMGAACIASAGAGIRNGTAAAMTMYPSSRTTPGSPSTAAA